MGRPYVNINHSNQSDILLGHLNEMLPKLKLLKGVVGITLNGGLSRGYADDLSEIDITIYLESDIYRHWHENKSPIPLGIAVLNGALYDIKVLDYDIEMEKSYDEVELWDLSYAKILFDPYSKISKLFEHQLSNKPDVSKTQGYLFGAWWNYKLAGDIWISRGDALQGHLTLNQSIPLLIKALFIANNEYIPHEKWLIHLSRTLDWKPLNWDERISCAMSTGDLSTQSLIDRQTCIDSIWIDIDNYIKDTYYPDLNLKVMQKDYYDLLKLLVQKQIIPVSEWNKKSNIAILNRDPFHKVVEITDRDIILNIEKLLNLSADDMYSWHYEIVKETVDNLTIG